MNFILKEDWIHETEFMGISSKKTLYKKGHIFEPNQDGYYEVIKNTGEIIKLTEESMSSLDIMSKIQDIDLIIEEVPEDDDNLVSNWRIQLDVKTTRKRLKEIEKIIYEKIRPLL
jgi:hypothetical protein